MGGLLDPGPSSLERLKTLDQLPNLQLQLHKAKQLCTHSARADMVAKWVLEKLKKSTDALFCHDSWNVLQTAIRLLPLNKSATLLGSSDILGLISKCLLIPEISKDLVLSITTFLNLLLLLSNQPRGDSLKAMLRVDSPEAARFVGFWFRHAYGLTRKESAPAPFLVGNCLLDPALQIWANRRQHAADHELFAQECLVPVALLQNILHKQSTTALLKRKHAEKDSGRSTEYSHALESLLARHIFLPTRTSFFRARDDPTFATKTHTVPHNSLDQNLAGLPELFASSDTQLTGHDKTIYTILPLLLDIAIRCITIQTPRQHQKERPWIDKVFTSLLSCILVDGKLTNSNALIEMLSVIGSRSSLSLDILRKIVRSHCCLDRKNGPVNELLVTKIVEIDASVFIDETLMQLLCDYITAADLESRQEIASAEVGSAAELAAEERRLSRKQMLCVPVIETFARNRKLSKFVDFWYGQLQQIEPHIVRSIWADLDDTFQALMEQNLTEAQILGVFDTMHNALKLMLRKDCGAAKMLTDAELNACMVILKAVLVGVRSDDIRDLLSLRVDALFEDLMGLFDLEISQLVLHCGALPLLTTTFRLWFSAFVARYPDGEAVQQRGVEIFSSEAVLSASKLHGSTLPGQENISSANPSRCDAAMFLASICSYFSSYKACEAASTNVVGFLAERASDATIQALLVYPDLLSIIDQNRRMKFLDALFHTAIESQEHDQSTHTSLDAIRALVVVSSTQPTSVVMDDIVSTAVRYLESDDLSTASGESAEHIAVTVLSTFQPSTLSANQRRMICSAVETLACPDTGNGNAILQRRFSLLIQLLTIPISGLSLYDNLWSFCSRYSQASILPVGASQVSEFVMNIKTMDLWEHTIRSILQQMLVKKERERHHASLLKLCQKICDHVNASYTNDSDSEGPSWSMNLTYLSVIKITLSEFSTVVDAGSPNQLFKPTIMKTYIDRLTIETQRLVSHSVSNDVESAEVALSALLDALSLVPQWILEATGIEQGEHEKQIQQAAHRILLSKISLQAPKAPSMLRQCFQICWPLQSSSEAGKDGDALCHDTLHVLNRNLGPRDHSLVLLSFLKQTESLDEIQKAEMMNKLLSLEESGAAAVSLLLVRLIISSSNKHNENAKDDSTGQTILPKILQVAMQSEDITTCRRACECIITVLREKPSMTNQYSIEATLSTLDRVARDRAGDGVIYLTICRCFTVLLQQHRSRLRDRLHIVVGVLKTLLACIFGSVKSGSKGLEARHARALVRIFQLLCSPPRPRKPSKSSELVDEARKAQAHVGQYVGYLVHHYCSQVLIGTLNGGVREALMPGLWAMIEAMEVGDAHSVKSLSSAMNNSERAVMRRVYDEYTAFGKWKGG